MANLHLIIFGALVAVSYVAAQDKIVECFKENEEYSTCTSVCQRYCNEPYYHICPFECIVGCVCKAGYVRETIDSQKCVLETECKNVPKCGADQEYRECATACPKYCGQPANLACSAICVAGCQCEQGYVKKNERSETCILESECPNVE